MTDSEQKDRNIQMVFRAASKRGVGWREWTVGNAVLRLRRMSAYEFIILNNWSISEKSPGQGVGWNMGISKSTAMVILRGLLAEKDSG